MARIAIVSDIHANYDALCAVMEDAFDRECCTEVVCLGDIIGYNAFPSLCLDYIRKLGCPVVKGNHDDEVVTLSRVLSNPIPSEVREPKMNIIAREAMEWTQKQLNEDQLQWLSRLQYQRIVRPADGSGSSSFTIVHSSLDQPKAWNYIFNVNDASSNFTRQFSLLCFHGHTHIPKVFYWNGRQAEENYDFEHRLAMSGYSEFHPEAGVKYFINVGSVGQPRDGDSRSCYGIYDTDLNLVIMRRVKYDLASAQQAIYNAGLPGYLAERLESGC